MQICGESRLQISVMNFLIMVTVHSVHSNTLRDAKNMNLLAQSPRSIVCFANSIYANRINSRGMSRVFCDLRSQKTPRGTLPVNSNELFHITVHPDVHFFQGMGNILIPERSSGQISIQPSHLSFIKLCIRRIFLLDRPA